MIHLFLNTYRDPLPQRNAEMAQAMRRNKACRHIDHVHEITDPARPSIRQLLAIMRSRVGWADVAVIANSDIYFDDTAALLNHVGYQECFALSRREGDQSEQLCEYPRGMQDAWVFRGPPPLVVADFPLGMYAGDNRLNRLFQDAGYTVYNPSQSIKIHHLHASNARPVRTEATKIPGDVLYVPPCSLPHIRHRSTDPILKPQRVAIIQLGRLGDIVNSLPIAFDLHRQGHAVFWYVQREFAPLLQGVSYVTPVIWEGPLKSPGLAIDHAAAQGFDRVLAIQVEDNPQPSPQKTRNYSTESWARAGYLDKYHILPCVFDRAQPPPEPWKPPGDKPILAYCLDARTSPYAQDLKRDMVRWLQEHFAADFALLPIGDPVWRPDALAVVLPQCKVLLSVDSFPLHMAYAAGTPTIAITAQGWIGSEPRRHWIEHINYAQSTMPQGRDKITAALGAVLAGNAEPGRLIAQPGNMPAQPLSQLRKLSILIASLKQHEPLLRRLLDQVTPQLIGHQEVEVIVDMDDGKTSLWQKRNNLLHRANGEYCCFLEVGDSVADNFVALVIQALAEQPDCVGFKVGRFESGTLQGVERHSIDFDTDDSSTPLSTAGELNHGISHLCPVRTAIARSIGFGPDGDAEYAHKLAASGLLDFEQFIDAVVYAKPR